MSEGRQRLATARRTYVDTHRRVQAPPQASESPRPVAPISVSALTLPQQTPESPKSAPGSSGLRQLLQSTIETPMNATPLRVPNTLWQASESQKPTASAGLGFSGTFQQAVTAQTPADPPSAPKPPWKTSEPQKPVAPVRIGFRDSFLPVLAEGTPAAPTSPKNGLQSSKYAMSADTTVTKNPLQQASEKQKPVDQMTEKLGQMRLGDTKTHPVQGKEGGKVASSASSRPKFDGPWTYWRSWAGRPNPTLVRDKDRNPVLDKNGQQQWVERVDPTHYGGDHSEKDLGLCKDHFYGDKGCRFDWTLCPLRHWAIEGIERQWVDNAWLAKHKPKQPLWPPSDEDARYDVNGIPRVTFTGKVWVPTPLVDASPPPVNPWKDATRIINSQRPPELTAEQRAAQRYSSPRIVEKFQASGSKVVTTTTYEPVPVAATPKESPPAKGTTATPESQGGQDPRFRWADEDSADEADGKALFERMYGRAPVGKR